jgi:penicillin G amidase
MRWLRRLGLVLFVLLCLGVAGWLWLLTSLPQTSGKVVLPGISAAVTIGRDAAGVPVISAANEKDAAFALGYVHAQDRLVQMELMRRVGAGRLAEVVGEKGLQTDRFMRGLGLARLVEKQFALLSPELQAVLKAYAAGVNAWLDHHAYALPPEFYLLRFRPEPWRPADCLFWGKLMALQLAGNFRTELLRVRLAAHVTPTELAQLFPPYPPDGPITLSGLAPALADRLYAALPKEVGPNGLSNNWVVDGRHSVSGKPILANDPHLGFSAPGVWYLARIETPDSTLTGATAPGLPYLVIGHNRRIGWGFTNTGGDDEDLFAEKIDPNDPGRYVTPDGSAPFETRQEEIRVRDAAPVMLTVRSTRHGPVLTDFDFAAEEPETGEVLALSATWLDPEDRTPEALWRMDHAGNWSEFNAALESFAAPEQNIVYADIEGRIGFTAPARLPIRAKGDGSMPVPGWSGDYDWTGTIPYADLPRGTDPASGHYVSANNKIVPDTYPYLITRDWEAPDRAERITALLDKTPRQSPDSTARIQADTLSEAARQLLPLLLEKARPADPRSADPNFSGALERLRHWDGRMDADRVEPLLFIAWLRELKFSLFFQKLGTAYNSYWGLRAEVIENILARETEWCGSLEHTVSDPPASDPPVKGDCGPVLAESLQRAVEELTRTLGPDMAGWRWDRVHIAQFPNPVLSRIPLLRDLFAVTIPAPGGNDTVNVGAMAIGDPDHPFADIHGAGLRMILDFADLDGARFMVVPGQSGNPLSSHYADLLKPWRDFEWLQPGRDRVVEMLVLEPG